MSFKVFVNISVASASDCTDVLAGKVFGSQLISAVKSGDLEFVQKWVKNPHLSLKMVDEGGRNALHWASKLGNTKQAKLLADPNRIDIHAKDHEGYTALIYASISGHVKIVGLILKEFIFSLENVDEFHTAYYLALSKGHKRIANILDETPLGYHTINQETIELVEDRIHIQRKIELLNQTGIHDMELKNAIRSYEQKRMELSKIVPHYSINNGHIYFKSKTLNQAIFVHSNLDAEYASILDSSGSVDSSSLERVLDILKEDVN